MTGAPGHSLTLVVEGGDATQIATVIAGKKGIAGAYGPVQTTLTDAYGIPHVIGFFARLRSPSRGR